MSKKVAALLCGVLLEKDLDLNRKHTSFQIIVRELLDRYVAICPMSGPVFLQIQWY